MVREALPGLHSLRLPVGVDPDCVAEVQPLRAVFSSLTAARGARYRSAMILSNLPITKKRGNQSFGCHVLSCVLQ